MQKVTETVCHESKRPEGILKVFGNKICDFHELNIIPQNSPCYLNTCRNFQSPEFHVSKVLNATGPEVVLSI